MLDPYNSEVNNICVDKNLIPNESINMISFILIFQSSISAIIVVENGAWSLVLTGTETITVVGKNQTVRLMHVHMAFFVAGQKSVSEHIGAIRVVLLVDFITSLLVFRVQVMVFDAVFDKIWRQVDSKSRNWFTISHCFNYAFLNMILKYCCFLSICF